MMIDLGSSALRVEESHSEAGSRTAQSECFEVNRVSSHETNLRVTYITYIILYQSELLGSAEIYIQQRPVGRMT